LKRGLVCSPRGAGSLSRNTSRTGNRPSKNTSERGIHDGGTTVGVYPVWLWTPYPSEWTANFRRPQERAGLIRNDLSYYTTEKGLATFQGSGYSPLKTGQGDEGGVRDRPCGREPNSCPQYRFAWIGPKAPLSQILIGRKSSGLVGRQRPSIQGSQQNDSRQQDGGSKKS